MVIGIVGLSPLGGPLKVLYIMFQQLVSLSERVLVLFIETQEPLCKCKRTIEEPFLDLMCKHVKC